MFKEVICHWCDGSVCVNCRGNGVRYIKIDDPIPGLQDEITELKRQLEIAKDGLQFECANKCAIGLNQCNARDVLDKLKSAGE